MISALLIATLLAATPTAEGPIVSGEFSYQTLEAAAAELTRETGEAIRIDPEIADKRVSVSFEEVPLEKALKLIAEEARVRVDRDVDVWILIGKEYAGRPISLDVRNAPLGDIFRLFHEISGLNVVVHPALTDTVITIDVDNVPWDQVLDLIAYTHDLQVSWEGNVVRIGPPGEEIVPRRVGKGPVGVKFRLFLGVRNGGGGVHTEEIVAGDSLTVVDAEWARDVIRQAGQLEEAFGLSEVRILAEKRSEDAWDHWLREEQGDYAFEAMATHVPGSQGGKIRIRASVHSGGAEVGSTEVLATPGRTFTVAGRDPASGDYLFLSITPWVGPAPELSLSNARPSSMLESQPKRTKMVQPKYPAELRKEGIQGKVILEIVIEENGMVSEADILFAQEYRLGEAARDAVRQWRYEPSHFLGEPARVRMVVQVQFRLE